MTLDSLKNLLLPIGPPVFHYFATGQTGNYIVWAEDGEGDAVHADGQKVERAITGTIDYFTKTENDPVISQIEAALDSSDGIAWSLNSVQYEQDTRYIHYEWVFEIDNAAEGEGDSG
jgi:hypothetical protein